MSTLVSGKLSLGFFEEDEDGELSVYLRFEELGVGDEGGGNGSQGILS